MMVQGTGRGVVAKKVEGVRVRLGQRESVLFAALYGVKYLTEKQIAKGIYSFDSSNSQSIHNRLVLLVRAEFLCAARVQLMPGTAAQVLPGGEADGTGDPRKLVGRALPNDLRLDRDQLATVYYLGPRGEEWCAQYFQPDYQPPGAPIVPRVADNWTHELLIGRIFLEAVQGALLSEMADNTLQWRWMTAHRGTTVRGLKSQMTSLRSLTPDSVITHKDQAHRIFLEMDRGTKRIKLPMGHSRFRDTIAATLAGYEHLFRASQYTKQYGDDKAPLLFFVVPDLKRKEQIKELAKAYPHLPIRIVPLRSASAWLRDWVDGNQSIQPLPKLSAAVERNSDADDLQWYQDAVQEMADFLVGADATIDFTKLPLRWRRIRERRSGR